MNNTELIEAIDEFIKGDIVQRRRFQLIIDNSPSIEDLFITRLKKQDFQKKTVRESQVPVGYRSPAFLIQMNWAVFGHVKWTRYDADTYFKYFASVEKKPSGSSEILLKEDDQQVLFVNDTIQEIIDIDAPPLFE